MLKRIMSMRIDAAERDLGASFDYARFMLNSSLGGFLSFLKILEPARYRKRLPADVYHASRLTSTLAEDCGPCVQIVINQALRDGVPKESIRALLENREEALSESIRTAVQYTRNVINLTDDSESREKLRGLFGDAGLVELALAISTSRAFPTIKRAMGFATSCSLTRYEL